MRTLHQDHLVRVIRPSGFNRYEPWYAVRTVKHPGSVMVWGFFLPRNMTMNGKWYQEVLEDHLLPFMAIHCCTNILQDQLPCHNLKRSKNYLSNKPFEVMDWPGWAVLQILI
jgi:hypothetical protein